jgi:hypothetical protein
MIDDDFLSRFTLEEHAAVGNMLKRYSHGIEQTRAKLAYSYPKSAKKEMKQLELALNNIKNVQASLQSKLLVEFSEKSDDELLPVYSGRYQPPSYS